MFEVTILGVLQGIAEFLPVSSSGHLVIAQYLLGIGKGGMRLDIFLHLGTLLAILVYYFGAVRRIVTRFDWLYMVKLLVSALPAVAVYFAFQKAIDSSFEDPHTVGAFLMFTGAVLMITRYIPAGGKDVSLLRALLMGLAQAFAILPGVSRSGMTLAVARSGKVEPSKSAEFSFLMSAPLIAGGSVLEIVRMAKTPALLQIGEISWGLTVYGAAVAFVVGLVSLAVLEKTIKSRWFWLFGPYCITAGLLTLFLI